MIVGDTLDAYPDAPDALTLFRPARVVDTILGLREEEEFVVWLFTRYVHFFFPTGVNQLPLDAHAGLVPLAATVEKLIERGEAGAFLAACKQGERGVFDPALAPQLARVRRLPDAVVEIPDGDLPALGAWSLEALLRRGPFELADCGLCRLPWIPERGAIYCERAAPGQINTCRSVMARRAFVNANRDYHRQRRSLYEKKRRGTLAAAVYDHWLADNRPGERGTDWVPFDEWKAKREGAERSASDG